VPYSGGETNDSVDFVVSRRVVRLRRWMSMNRRIQPKRLNDGD